MLNVSANVSSILPKTGYNIGQMPKTTDARSGFTDTIKAVEKYISKTNNLQELSDTSIKDMLSGKNEDITTMVSAVAKADMSFKLLVGVRNKLIEAYKQTMNMQL